MKADAFDQLEAKIQDLMSQIQESRAKLPGKNSVADGPIDEIRLAAILKMHSSELTKLWKKVSEQCDNFLKHSVEAGTKARIGKYVVNHYTRNVFDKVHWEHHCKTDEYLRPLFESAEELKNAKDKQKAMFQHLSSSVSVTIKEDENVSKGY